MRLSVKELKGGRGGRGKREARGGRRDNDTFASPFPLPSIIPAIPATNEFLDAEEAPARRALRARKSRRDPVIAHPDEITKTKIFITQIPEILDE
jgi:hypothetical protein